MVRTQKNLKRGSVLAVVIIIVLLLVIAGLSMLTIGQQIRMRSINETQVMQSKAAADAGLDRAIYLVQQQTSGGGAWTGVSGVTNSALSGTSATYSYTVTGTPATGISITATGRCGPVQRTVNCTLKCRSYWVGLGADGAISLGNNFNMTAFPATAISTILTNSTANGAITITDNASLPADLVVGPGANLSNAISISGNVSAPGQRSVATAPTVFPSVVPPSTGAFAGAPRAAISNPSAPITPAQSGKYAGFTAGGSNTVTISGGDVVLYITGNMAVRDNSNVIINNGSTLTLYLGGTFSASNNAMIKFQSTDPATAAKSLKLLGTDSCTSVQISNNGNFYGAIYAPKANIAINNNANSYGAIVGKTISMTNNSDFNYVAGLLYELMGNVPLQVQLDRWWE
jgi:hypothetical protein